MRICMLVYNNCLRDARVMREAATLREGGHEVVVLAVADTVAPDDEIRHGTRIVRIRRNPPHAMLLRGIRRARRLASRAHERMSQTAANPSAEGSGRRPPDGPARTGRIVRLVHKPLTYIDWYGRAFRVGLRLKADTYHAHDLNTVPVAWLLAAFTRGRLIYDAHELYPDVSTLSRLERGVWRRLEGPLVQRSDRVVTVCDSIAQELVRRHRIANPVVLLNCPPRSHHPGASADARLLRRKIQRSGGDEPIVLYQGGFAPNRGLPSLVRAAHHLEDGLIVLMGWGRLEGQLRALIDDEGLEDRVVLTTPVREEELISYTAGASVGVIPYEPVGLNNTFTTPNKLFEYIAAGVPVVATRLPELERFVEGLEIGTTFADVTPRAIADAIMHVLRDPDGHARMRERAIGKRRALSWEAQSTKLLTLYSGDVAKRSA